MEKQFFIDPEIIKKHAYLPEMLAKLSYQQPEEALRLLRNWGEGNQPVKSLFEEVTDLLHNEKRQDI
ncbi:hypothetical protein FZC66_00580 [Priestia megaterium]|nr:hypothetical protein FZC66_00580 [Priestia megaterium]